MWYKFIWEKLEVEEGKQYKFIDYHVVEKRDSDIESNLRYKAKTF